VRKCPYCDFNSHPLRGVLPESAYVAALLGDLEQDATGLSERPLQSVFIGGGTPSLLSSAAINQLLQGIGERIPCAPGMEITLEANPGTVDTARFEGYLRAGVNRLSLGVQSFSADSLVRLGRIHDPRQAHDAVVAAQRVGFREINLDLMYGLPGQTPARAAEDLAAALALAPTHLSYYQLTLEPNTAFARTPPPLPEEDLIADIEQQARETLAKVGFSDYEISAYALPQHRCRHNLNYWQFGDYLGIGAGAHGKCSDQATHRVERRWKRSHPDAYLAAATERRFVAGRRQLAAADLIVEFMMNALRLREGFAPALFEARTGLPFSQASPRVNEAIGRGLLEDQGNIRTTELGRRFLNDLLAMFVPGPAEERHLT
jgi:putative oxygen-independent coproporphyrinogen III oxidase